MERVFAQSSLMRRENISFKPQKHKMYLESNAGYMNKSVPDFVFSMQKDCERDVFSILDAKMKPKWVKSIFPDKEGLKDTSLNSLCGGDIDKCIRDMTVFHAAGTGVVFPVSKEDEREARRKYGPIRYEGGISNLNHEQAFYFLPFVVPAIQGKTEAYPSWKDAFQKSLGSFEKNLVEKVLVESRNRYLSRRQMDENARRYEELRADLKKLLESARTPEEMQQLHDIWQKYESGGERP